MLPNKQNQITSMIFNSNLYHSNLQMYIWICMCQRNIVFMTLYIHFFTFTFMFTFYLLSIFPCFKCRISCKLRWGIPLRLCVDKTQTWQLTMLSFLLLNFLMHFWGVNNVHFYNIFLFLSKFYDWYNVTGSI